MAGGGGRAGGGTYCVDSEFRIFEIVGQSVDLETTSQATFTLLRTRISRECLLRSTSSKAQIVRHCQLYKKGARFRDDPTTQNPAMTEKLDRTVIFKL